MNAHALLRALPPFQHKRDVVVKGNQSIRDIRELVLQTHEVTASDYDTIAQFFNAADPVKQLFEFVKSLNYKEEPKADQTTRSPAGILELSERRGIDCKHMSAFIAGVLDALNRTGNYQFDWYYRFVSYDKADSTPGHVFVVLKDKDVWLDPTPIKRKSGGYTERYYNDRLAEPTFYSDQTLNMLSYLHGVHYRVTEDSNTECMGCCENEQPQGVGFIAEAMETAKEVAEILPDGGLKDFLNTFLDNPGDALKQLFSGRTYNIGEYVAGERYMRNILGMMEIQNRKQVPDEYVPQALVFWSVALGVPVSSDDHLQALTRSAGDYLNWAGGTFSWVDPQQVARARRILTEKIGWTTTYHPRDKRWPLDAFGSLPYIYPIHNPSAGTGMSGRSLFTGTHPILNIQFVEGYPKPTTTVPVPPPVTTTPNTQTEIDWTTPTPTTTTTTTPQNKNASMNLLLIVGLGAAALYAANKKK